MTKTTVGFVGVGRLGLPMACALVGAGFEVVCTSRGRAAELVAHGGTVAGDGTPRAVAEASDVVVSCLPTVASLEQITLGPDGMLAAERVPPLIEASTFAVPDKARIREKFVARGSELFDAPVSGTPAMVKAKIAVMYGSGDQSVHDRFIDVCRAISPGYTYVGEFGTGTRMKLVAQFLAMVHVTATAEAMAYAKRAGLDLSQVAEVISASPGAMSGQFKVRAPMIADGRFEGRMVTVALSMKDLEEIISYGEELGAELDLIRIVREHFRKLMADGHGEADPAKMFDALAGDRLVHTP